MIRKPASRNAPAPIPDHLKSHFNPGQVSVKTTGSSKVLNTNASSSSLLRKVSIDLSILFLVFVVGILAFFIISCIPRNGKSLKRLLIGKYKRDPPKQPQDYFDIACIDVHGYDQFMNDPHQVQRCRELKPFNPGPLFSNLFKSKK